MLLIGSKAAKLRGFLPAWRGGWYGDIDLQGAKAEMEVFRKVAPITEEKKVNSTNKDKYLFFIPPRNVEFDTSPLPSVEMIYQLPDTIDGEIFGLPVKIISAEVMYLQKRSIQGIFHKDKHPKDLEWLESRINLTEQHLLVYKQLRKEALERFREWRH